LFGTGIGRVLATGPDHLLTVASFHAPHTVSTLPLGRMNWMEQPLVLVDVVPPFFVHVSVPTEARESMKAPRAW
jgi:hypothetical protein